MWKLIQKRTYDLLSHRYGLMLLTVGLFLLIISALQFGESVMEWSTEKYEAMFNSFSDNVASKSYQDRLCLPVPIDVVYTWVNGSDPEMIQQLKSVRLLYENASTAVSWCPHCVIAPLLVINPALPQNFSSFIFPEAVEKITLEGNVTAIKFSSVLKAEEAYNNSANLFKINNQNFTLFDSYLTTDENVKNSVIFPNTVFLRRFPESYKSAEIRRSIPEKIQVTDIFMYENDGLAVISLLNKENYTELINSNFTIDGKTPTLTAARVVWQGSDNHDNEDMSASRFQDNEELRYSLRSIDRFAPWVRHIYIVTNGQIPSWLNLDHPRVTIITHEELFLNKSHLPSFSSPAIESHIHQIPNLSDKFIYMNDDVLFGREVWPDDFYTPSRGQKVFLTWPVPNCAEGCPNSWIHDGYCDKPCNNTGCDWDGGDCDGGAKEGVVGGRLPTIEIKHMYCNTGCANSWLSDRYCDQSCNVFSCAFDAGDCGTKNYNKLHRIDLKLDNNTVYNVSQGITMLYFNLTAIFAKVHTANYEENDVIRAVAVSNKFHVLTLLMFEDYNATNLQLSLTGEDYRNVTIQIHYSIFVNTQPIKERALIEVKKEARASNVTVPMTPFIFHDVLLDEQLPRLVQNHESWTNLENFKNAKNISTVKLPTFLKNNVTYLQLKFQDGDLSEKGFALELFKLFQKYNISDIEQYLEKELDHANKSLIPLVFHDDSKNSSTSFKSRTLKSFFDKLAPIRVHNVETFDTVYVGRKLLDTFGDSLLHVNRLYNKEFGLGSRKVPGHMPHMIDKNVMNELHAKFPEEWDVTSSHQIRSGTDMQFAFSYFYFLMSARQNVSVADFFVEIDVDNSGVLSDREIRTMATRLFELPLDLQTLTSLENNLINCSKHLPENIVQVPNSVTETYYEQDMPQVTNQLVVNCHPLVELIRKVQAGRTKYKYEEMSDEEISFKMVRTNISNVVGQLDDVRKNPKKFVCLNDNIDHNHGDAATVRAVLHDFYESFFPHPSQFELPNDYRNRFLYMSELREWRDHRDWLKFCLHLCLCLLILYTIASYFSDKLQALCRRIVGRRRSVNNAITV